MPSLGQLYPLIEDVELPDDIPYTQCSRFELKFLYLIGRHRVSGTGELVELGSGGGGSTYAFARGLSHNLDFDRSTGRLHAYDFFRVGKGTFATPKFFRGGKAPEGESSFLDDFRAALGSHMDFIEIHAGDIWETSDPSDTRPIDFLHIDIAKTENVWRAVAERFLPRLREGSIVLHQDFASPRLPWLHYSTGLLLPYIEIAGAPIRSTLAFEVVRPIPDEVLDRIAGDAFTLEEKQALISRVQEHVDIDYSEKIPFKSVLELAKAFTAHYAGKHRQAWQIAAPLREVPYLAAHRTDHFEQLQRELTKAAAPAARRPASPARKLARMVKRAVTR
ncbi:hypothetical protein SRB5_64350 [Streptomyces sp. RB5]|uniref:Uncharacterized protein n=1 Tax=Streptomyces smaragdinus TaxID=2585196 RepID=A0A7K0CRW8_9ACTN|nr:class I SAM-dependent methyltransferase [Streptomyces smaragdinus]MQY16237.1 hypothetical protein [Streptomyces smaragdinus]